MVHPQPSRKFDEHSTSRSTERTLALSSGNLKRIVSELYTENEYPLDLKLEHIHIYEVTSNMLTLRGRVSTVLKDNDKPTASRKPYCLLFQDLFKAGSARLVVRS